MADINLGVGGANSATGGYDIENSLKFEADNNESLQKTLSSDGNKQTWTVSCWVKRTELANQMIFAAQDTYLYFVDNKIRINTRNDLTNYFFETAALFRDTSAWYHCVVAVDTTNSTASERTRVYVNGVEYSSTNTDYQNNTSGTRWNDSTKTQRIGKYDTGINFSGYLAEFHSIDGQQLSSTDFGEYDEDSGIWKPKAYTGSYGSKGFYLDFESSGSLGADSSGNSNDFTLNNITSADQATDTPTNNFAIPNVIGTTRVNKFTYTEGGTKVVSAGSTDWDSWANTIAVGNGKWYAEFKMINTGNYFVGVGSEEYYFVGAGSGTGFPEIYYGYSGTNSVGFYNANGDIYNNGTQVVIGTTYTANDIISVALDMDNGKVYFAKNGTYINSQNPVTGTNAQNLPDTEARYFIGTSQYQANLGIECNYGGYTTTSIASGNTDANGYGTFEYAPPSGYYALCTKNLAEYG
jgi:hypothetical protein